MLTIQPTGIRTALAVLVPLFVGQEFGRDDLGVLVGLGGLNLSSADKYGANWTSLLVATACIAFAGLCGSSISPHSYLAVAAIFLWAFSAGLLGAFGDLVGNIGFTATIMFAIALGMPPLPHFVSELARAGCIGIGGLWATFLCVVLWRLTGVRSAAPPPGPEGIEDESLIQRFLGNLTLKSTVFQHSLRIGVSTLIAVAAYKGLHIEHGYWLVLTVLVIVKPDFAATRLRASERMLGSVIGGALAILVVATIHNKLAIDILLAIFCVVAYSHSQANYGLFVTFLTPFVVLLINVAAPGDWQIAVVRILNTIVGGVLAVTVAYLLRPRESAVPADVVPQATSG